MIHTDVFRTIRDSVCAIAVGTCKLWNYANGEEKPNGLNFHILGTGFLASRNLVMTNRHVFDVMVKQDKDWIGVVFIRADHDGNINFSLYKVDKKVVLSSSPTWSETEGKTFGTDVAFLEINADSVAQVENHHKPVVFAEKERIQIGAPIGVCGYIYGNQMFGDPRDSTTIRFSPTLLQGHVAGLAPFDNLPNHPINLILTDVTNGGGLSGSPVFTEDGRVIGIHSAGQTELVFGPDPDQGGLPVVKKVTQGIGFAVPTPRDFVEKVKKHWNEVIAEVDSVLGARTEDIVDPNRI